MKRSLFALAYRPSRTTVVTTVATATLLARRGRPRTFAERMSLQVEVLQTVAERLGRRPTPELAERVGRTFARLVPSIS